LFAGANAKPHSRAYAGEFHTTLDRTVCLMDCARGEMYAWQKHSVGHFQHCHLCFARETVERTSRGQSQSFVKNAYMNIQRKKDNFILITSETDFRIRNASEDLKGKFVFYSQNITYGIDFNISTKRSTITI
jgi:hypothetical protein